MSALHNTSPQEPSPFLFDLLHKPLASLVLEGFYRREELAQQLGVSIRTIDRWEALRIGPPRVCVGKTILYSLRSVREWLVAQERQPAIAIKKSTGPGESPIGGCGGRQ
jgi:hypothetical protein